MGSRIVLAISLLITISLSSLIGLSAWLMNSNFWGWFIVSFALQFIINGLWESYTTKKFDAVKKQTETADKLIDSLQNIEIPCAYCNIMNKVNVIIGSDNNQYKCTSCNNENKVLMDFRSTRITVPLAAEDVVSRIFKELDKNDTGSKK